MSDFSLKTILIEEINSLKKLDLYFNYNDIKRIIKEKNIQITNSTLRTYLHFLKNEKVIFDAGRGWYSIIEKEFKLNTKPVENIIKKLRKKLPLLPFSCWSTEQLNSFTHHILSKFIIFVYTDSDYINNTAEILMDEGYKVYKNPTKTEIEKSFRIEKKTVVLRPSITKQPENNKNYAPIEKILINFLMENRVFKIMEKIESEKVVENSILSGRIYISKMFSYSKRRKYNAPIAINQVQLNNKGGDS